MPSTPGRCEEDYALGAGASRRRCLICNMEYFGRGRCINAPRCPRRWYRDMPSTPGRCEEDYALGAGGSRRRCLICNMEYFGRGQCINAPRCPRRWYRQRYGEEDLMAARCQWARILKVRELWRRLRTSFWTGWAYKQFELLLLAIRTQTKGATPRGAHPPQLSCGDQSVDDTDR